MSMTPEDLTNLLEGNPQQLAVPLPQTNGATPEQIISAMQSIAAPAPSAAPSADVPAPPPAPLNLPGPPTTETAPTTPLPETEGALSQAQFDALPGDVSPPTEPGSFTPLGATFNPATTPTDLPMSQAQFDALPDTPAVEDTYWTGLKKVATQTGVQLLSVPKELSLMARDFMLQNDGGSMAFDEMTNQVKQQMQQDPTWNQTLESRGKQILHDVLPASWTEEPAIRDARDEVARELATLHAVASDAQLNVNPYTLKGATLNLVKTAGSILPAVGAFVVNPILGLASFFGPQFMAQYADSRLRRGRDRSQSFQDAMPQAVINALTIDMPIGQAMKDGASLLSKSLSTSGAAALQGALSEITSLIYNYNIFGEKMSTKEALLRVANSAIDSGVSGALFAGAMHPVQKARLEWNQNLVKRSYDDYLDKMDRVTDPYTSVPMRGDLEGRAPANITPWELAKWDQYVILKNSARQALDDGIITADHYTEVMNRIEAERLRLRDKLTSSIENSQQLTLPGFDIKRAVEDPTWAALGQHAPNLDASAASVMDPANHVAFLDFHKKLLSKGDASPFINDMYKAAQMLQHGDVPYILDKWFSASKASAMGEIRGVLEADTVYQAKLHQLLDKYFPGVDTIPLYVGHNDDFSRIDTNAPLTNATFDIIQALAFGKYKSGTPYVSYMEVPKTSILNVLGYGTHLSEKEVLFKWDGVRYHGFFNATDVLAHTHPDQVPLIAVGEHPDLLHKGQLNLPGFGPQEVQPAPEARAEPAQLDLFSTGEQGSFDLTHTTREVGGWEKVSSQLGSNAGGAYRDPNGNLWYVKTPLSIDHVRNEVLANRLYRAMGVKVPDVEEVTLDGKPAVASRWMNGLTQVPMENAQQLGTDARHGFVADAWLANWDVHGLTGDNMLRAENGAPVRLDQGGALLFRAQGVEKGDAFGDTVTEMEKMRTTGDAARLFSHLTNADIGQGVRQLQLLDPNTIRNLVMHYGPGGEAAKDLLTDTLLARRRDIIERYGEPVKEAIRQGKQTGNPVLDAIVPGFTAVDGTTGHSYGQMLDLVKAWHEKLFGGPEWTPKLQEQYDTILRMRDWVMGEYLPKDMMVEVYYYPENEGAVHIAGDYTHATILMPAGYGQLPDTLIFETMAHELGHLVMTRNFAEAPQHLKDEIMNAFLQDKARVDALDSLYDPTQQQTLADLLNDLFLPGQAQDHIQHMENFWPATQEFLNQHMTDFNEWVANQVGKYVLGPGLTEKSFLKLGIEPNTHIDTYFHNLSSNIVEMYRKLFNETNPGKGIADALEPTFAVQNFLDHLQFNEVAKPTLTKAMEVQSFAMPWFKKKKQVQQTAGVTAIGPMTIVQKLKALATPQAKKLSADLDNYSAMVQHTWTLLQVIDKNAHIMGFPQYKEAVELWASAKMRWISEADSVIKEWRGIDKMAGDSLAKFMFAMTKMEYLGPKAARRMPTQAEELALVQKYKVTPDAYNFYKSRIVPMFDKVLQKAQDVEEADARRHITDPMQLAQKLTDIRSGYQELRQTPYFPLSRFGMYTVSVRDPNSGKIMHMETFETELERDRAYDGIRAQFKGQTVNRGKLSEDISTFRALPPSFVTRLAAKLNLNPAQQQQVEELAYEFSPGRSFRHHFQKRNYVGGYSEDAQRAFADYFFHGANHLARMEYMDDLNSAIGMARNQLSGMQGVDDINLTKRQELINHLERHREYILNPQNEMAALRAVGFHWYLGFNAKAAAVNLTQVPFVAHPYLTARYGQLEGTRALLAAYKDVRNFYMGTAAQRAKDPNYWRAVDRAVSQGWLDESMASDLAATAEGAFLRRFAPGGTFARLMQNLSTGSSYLFQQAERLNRRVVFRAAYDLAMKNQLAPAHQDLWYQNPRQLAELTANGWTHAEATAFLAAKDAVQKTQYEYASWNRPELFRGPIKSNVFLFFNYLQNSLWNFRHNPGGKQSLLMYALAGGLMGLPFADDLKELIQFAARRMFGKDFNIEREVRSLLVDMGSQHPDLFLHGMARYGFGLSHIAELVGIPAPSVDLSGSMSFGNVIPGLRDLGPEGDFNQKFVDGTANIGGGLVGMGVTFLQTLADQNPDQWKRWERMMPSEMKAVSRAARWYERGSETNSTGGSILQFDPTDPKQMAEIAAQSLGFTPTRMAQKWDEIRAEQEVAAFWKTRREMLLQGVDWAYLHGDREAIADSLDAIANFNKDVISPAFSIRGKDVRQSLRSRARNQALTARGLPQEKRMAPVSTGVIQPMFPEVREEKVP